MLCFVGFYITMKKSSNPTEILFTLIIILLVMAVAFNLYSFITAIRILVSASKGKYSAAQLAKLNMTVKLVHIPAYIIHFCLAILGFFLSVWGIAVILWVIFIDLVTISLSGIVGIGANIRAKKENRISAGRSVLYSILGFVYCVDVVVSIILNRKVKKEPISQ